MKKKIVSLFVFVMMSASLNARAQESIVDKDVSNGDNVVYTYVCKGNDETNSAVITLKNTFHNPDTTVEVTVANGSELGLNSSYAATLSSEASFYYTVHTYTFINEVNAPVAELVLSKKNPGMTRGGNVFCGRAGCDFPSEPILIYSALLKVADKEVSFTCQ